ncbi:right-handed parallel beta-helix repeat-containing protein [Breznakia pachnodae]|uniref:Outer membrane repeat protein n=1 Tax=Breznakia pachnodae TaxID=265178 RepID=A0ABU0E1G4_9FIRM|nr:right-handed parallel beta-helix repeat-containing protein [Breznakia pachnodae]MDQ0360715.1 putative outer membrane repeat protein [Breznakia pachnodae]
MKRIKKAPLLLSLLLIFSLIASPNISQVFADDNGSSENEVITEETNTNEVENEIEEPTQGSISGLVWFDKNENGIKESNESIISGVALYLYRTEDKSNVITQTASDTNGNYVFDNLDKGSYYVAVRAQAINGTNYLVPIASIQTGSDNKFDVDYSIEPVASYSSSINVSENDVININAGMRKQQTIVPLSGSYIVTNDTTSETSPFSSLNEAVASCTISTYKYTITANANDTSIGDVITIKADQDITITSATLSTVSLKQDKDGDRHFIVEGTLTLDNVILEGNGNSADGNENGGVKVNSGGSLTVESDATIQSCNWDKGGAINSDNGTIIIKGSIINNNAKSDGGGIYLTGSGGKPSHLTITDGAVISNNKAQNGAGIYSNWQATIDIKGGSITSNAASNEGGGIHFNSGTINMSGGSVDNNSSKNVAGGIKATDGATVTLSGGKIDKNTSNYGGGLLVEDSTLILSGADIINNTANSEGGGVKVDRSTVKMSAGKVDANTANSSGGGFYLTGGAGNPPKFELTNGSVSNNKAHDGAGIYSNWKAEIEIIDGSITTNTASNDGAGIHFNSGTLNMSGGSVDNNTSTHAAGGIKVSDGATVTISGGVIDANTSGTNGGGIHIEDSTLNFTNGKITGNSATGEGGGVRANRSTIQIDSGNIEYNTASNGAGIYISGDSNNFSSINLKGGSINNNTASSDGGGIRSTSYVTITIDSGNINDNKGTYGAGISANNNSTIILNSGKITNNTNASRGGGVNIDNRSTSITINGGEISYNEASDGGGIIATDGASITITNGTINNNKASAKGGAIDASNDCTISMTGGSIIDNQSSGSGGGIYAAGNTITITSGTFTNNLSGDDGGGIYHTDGTLTIESNSIFSKNSATVDGGAIRVTTGTSLTINNSKIEDNTAAHGAGFSANNNSKVIIDSSSFNDNIATQRGGGINIDNSTTMKITDSTITDNEANTGGGIIASLNSTIDLDDCTITGNSVTGDGGAIKLENSILTIENATIDNNQSVSHGGGIYLTWGSNLTINKGSITNNNAGRDGGGIYTEKSSYKDPVESTGYSNISVDKDNVTVNSNTASTTSNTPSNASSITNFNGNLLNNNDINYYPEKIAVTYYGNGGQPDYIEEDYNMSDPVTVKSQSQLGFTAPTSTPNYVIRYWTTDPTGEGGIQYKADGNDSFVITEHVALYAVWGPASTISGYVFEDTNKNGSIDSDEELSDKVVSLFKYDESQSKYVDTGETYTTDSDGKYTFEVDMNSKYKVYFKVTDGELGKLGFTTKGNASSTTSSHANQDGFSDPIETELNEDYTVNAGYLPSVSVTGLDGVSLAWIVIALGSCIAIALLYITKKRNKARLLNKS